MLIAKKLGLKPEIFCRMIITTKMLLSNVLGHAAELHYEKFLNKNNVKFQKAPTDVHYDYIINDEKNQVKRWETDSTDDKFIRINLTKTHGNRNGADAFYKRDDFDNLIVFDVGFSRLKIMNSKDIPKNSHYSDRLPGKFKLNRETNDKISTFDKEILETLKIKNSDFPEAIERFRKKYNLLYLQLLEKCCNLQIDEIDSLFSEDNFRLITGAKGFAAEEHFNVFLEKHKIPYKQDKQMYSKVDHWVNGKIRVQVKIPNERANTEDFWGVKTHKSHGHGVGELYKANAFDVLAFFIGFKMDKRVSKYLPVSVSPEFIFVPINELQQHPKYPGYLKRISKIRKSTYKINDLSLLQ